MLTSHVMLLRLFLIESGILLCCMLYMLYMLYVQFKF